MRIPFAVQSYRSRSLPVSAQRCVNMFAEAQPQGAKNELVIFNSPGIVQFATCGTGPIRGLWVMNNILYAVSGTRLYSVSSAGVATDVGGNILGSGLVDMSDNGTQLCVVNGAQGYIYTLVGGFQLITDTAFNPAKTVTFFDNYFVFEWVNTNEWFISNTLDGLTYDPLAFASAEVSPDYILATVNQQENLLLFGQKTIETWYNSGDVNFPFNRYDGATIERGCSAAYSPVKEDNSVFFLGDDLIFYRLNGVVPVRVSTHAIEAAWSAYPSVADTSTWSFTWQGHKFVVVTFPIGNATWIYDISTNLWHERVSFTANNEPMGRWRASCGTNAYNKVMVGDYLTGNIGYLDQNTFTDFGNMTQAYLVAPVIHDPDRRRVFMDRFELDIQAGVGLATGQGSNPQVMLDWSDDGGYQFNTLQPWATMGAQGATTTRLRWLRLGQTRNRVMRVTISDPVCRTIIGASATMRVGKN